MVSTIGVAKYPAGTLGPLHADVKRVADGFRIPVDRRHPWARFVCGLWWECQVAGWLEEWDISFERNVQIQRPGGDNRASGATPDTETDVLVRCPNGEMRVIECKVQPEKISGFIDIVKLLSEQRNRYGKTKSAFMLSPAFWWGVTENVRKEFQAACDIRQIAILESAHDLQTWLPANRGNTLSDYGVPC